MYFEMSPWDDGLLQEKDVTPLLTHWSYVFLALTYRRDDADNEPSYLVIVQGVVPLLSSWLPYFPNFSALSKHTLDIEYHVYIWQVSPQLSCGDTCQIWMWFNESKRYFCKIENFAYGEINKHSFSNPHPWTESSRHWSMGTLWLEHNGCHFQMHFLNASSLDINFTELGFLRVQLTKRQYWFR